MVRRLAEPGSTFADVKDLVAGDKGREMLRTGNMSQGIYWASMVQGLIHDIPTCKELIDRIIADAESILDQRVQGFRR